jgi:hypothetical protein
MDVANQFHRDGEARTTIAETVRYLVNRKNWPEDEEGGSPADVEFIGWPPDLFAVCSALLRSSAAYLTLVDNWPPDVLFIGKKNFVFRESDDSYVEIENFNRENHLKNVNLEQNAMRNIATVAAWRQLIRNVSISWATWLDKLSIPWEAEKGVPSNFIEQKAKRGDYCIPDEVIAAWESVRQAGSHCLRDISVAELRELTHSLIFLVAVSDEVSEGAGIRASPQSETGYKYSMIEKLFRLARLEQTEIAPDADKRTLSSISNSATLCRSVNARKMIVLPKMKTPQAGVSVRGLTFHLSAIRSNEVRPSWRKISLAGNAELQDSLTLLLIPYPWKVFPSQFSPLKESDFPRHYRQLKPTNRRFFKYSPTHTELSEKHLVDILRVANDEVGRIDGVVFPEMALPAAQLDTLTTKVFGSPFLNEEELARFLVAGVVDNGNPFESEKRYSRNYAAFRALIRKEKTRHPLVESAIQHKHHRWHLDQRQIKQYSLGSKLSVDYTWVEHIEVPTRRIHFFMVDERILVTSLICEDLAQADPIGDVIRAIGPNLVICLLADGPQINSRWSARYATGLADDPGCSVLTLSSMGMVNSSMPESSDTMRRQGVIGQWKDPTSQNQELILPDGASGLVACLSLSEGSSHSLDGRMFERKTITPVLAGTHPIYV